MNKLRLDQLLVERGFFPSRAQAQSAILAGLVFVNGQRVDKAGTKFAFEIEIEVKGKPIPYVSRGGLKLEKALDVFSIDVKGIVAADIGASTGGFTDCLLQQGASKVYAIDVGYGQLAWSLRKDQRVVVKERLNARYLKAEDLGEKVDLVVTDVSFISLRKIFPAIKEILKDTGRVVALIKPQFEAGPESVGKKGIVKDPTVHKQVLADVISSLESLNFILVGLDVSPITGAEGNIEFLSYWGLGECTDNHDVLITKIVAKAHGGDA